MARGEGVRDKVSGEPAKVISVLRFSPTRSCVYENSAAGGWCGAPADVDE